MFKWAYGNMRKSYLLKIGLLYGILYSVLRRFMGYKIINNSDKENHEGLKLLASKVMKSQYNFNNSKNATTHAVFSFSNENLNEIFKHRRLKNKRVATVGSSGDQVLYSILKGCRDVTCIDADPYTQPYTELKLAAIKNLTFEEFLDYFRYDNILNHKYYAKISHDLSEYSKAFWDEVMLNSDSTMSFAGISMVLFKIFQSVSTYKDFISTRDAMEYCSNKKKYNLLKESLDEDIKIEFIQSGFDEFHENLRGRYDLILLSNIYDYIDNKIYLNEVKKLKYFNLKPFGEMQLHYDFNNGIMTPILTKDVNKMFLFKKTRVKPVKDIRPMEYWYGGKIKKGMSEKMCNVVYL